MKKLTDRLLNIGITHCEKDDVKNIQILNLTTCLAFITVLLYALGYLYTESYYAFSINITTLIAIIGVFLLTALGKNRVAPILLTYTVFLEISILRFFFIDAQPGLHFYLVSLSSMALLLINHKDKFAVVLLILSSISFFMYFEYIDQRPLFQENIPEDIAIIFHAASTLGNAIVALIVTSIFYFKINHYAKTLKQEKEFHKKLSTFDSLTGLYNRYYYDKSLLSIFKSEPLIHQTHLAIIDLDNFKSVNDVGGHMAGDKILKEVASIIKQHSNDKTTTARIGGDEFSIIFKNMKLEVAIEECNKICNAITNLTIQFENKTFSVGSSIGLATLTEHTYDEKSFFHCADAACYKAKRAGKNQVCVN